MQAVPPIIVGFDGSNAASDALRWALSLGERTGTPIRAVTAWHVPASVAGDDMLSSDDLTAMYEAARHEASLVSQRAKYVASRYSARTTFSADIQHGNAASVLLSESRLASMLVVGTRGRSPQRQALLGSNARRCVTHAARPTVIVPPGTPASQWHTRPIIVGFDGSEQSKLALQWAGDLAAHTGAALRILAIHDHHHRSIATRLIDGSPISAEWSQRRDAEMAVDEARTVHADFKGSTPAVFEVVEGKAATVLGEAGRHGSLLVVGSRGLSGVKRLVMGSVSAVLIGSPTCPTLVVPAGATRNLDSPSTRLTAHTANETSPLWSMGARARQLHEAELVGPDMAT